ncbi:hypothetical protein K438DRAFT_1778534 [Mycena galopus ATCC 62051]|nr:hypothetical protein K438DRAFT_1778534 [Mycena galopus ATCC 62051]
MTSQAHELLENVTLDILVPSGGFWIGFPPAALPPIGDSGGTGKKLVSWRQEGQLRQFRQHAPAETGELEVRGDEEMEAEENERRWRRNTPKYRLQASNWQMERNGAHMILATDADLYLRYGAPKTKSLVTNAMDAAERENAHYPNRGRAVDTTDANYPSPSIVSVCREIERWVSGVEKTKAP